MLLQVDNAADPQTGVVQLRLSNGIAINYRHTDNEPQAAMIRMVAAGGRACEGAIVVRFAHRWYLQLQSDLPQLLHLTVGLSGCCCFAAALRGASA